MAVLDDSQDIALQMADWHVPAPDTKVQVFRDHLSNPELSGQQCTGQAMRVVATLAMANGER